MADQRADTPGTEAGGRPRTAAGRELLDDPTILLMRESAASGGEILGINEGELELHILAIEAEAAADSLRSVGPAAAEPPADVRRTLAEAFVAAVEGYGVADIKGTDPMFFVDIMLGTLREKGVVLDRAAQPPRGSLTDPVREHFEEWGVHMCDSTHLAGDSLTATEPPLDGSGYYGEHTYRAGSPRGVTPALDVERLAEAMHDEEHGRDWYDDGEHEAWVAKVRRILARLGSPALPTASGEDSDDGD